MQDSADSGPLGLCVAFALQCVLLRNNYYINAFKTENIQKQSLIELVIELKLNQVNQ